MKVDIHSEDARGNIITTLTANTIRFRGKRCVIPKGFGSDGMSVPRMFWSIISPHIDPRTQRASICHDWIYREQPEGWTRKEADLMLYCYLLEDGFPVFLSLLSYRGVRLGGWIAWGANKSFKEATE